MYKFDESEWSTIIVHPSLWWRLKALFCAPKIVFSWGQGRYMTEGFLGETCLAIGGVPVSMKERARKCEC